MNKEGIDLLRKALAQFKVGKITLNTDEGTVGADLYDIWFDELGMVLRNYEFVLQPKSRHYNPGEHKVVRFGDIEPSW